MNKVKKWVCGALGVGAAVGLVLITQFDADKPVSAGARTPTHAVSTAGQVAGPASGNGAGEVAGEGAGARASLGLDSWFDRLPGDSTIAAVSPLDTMTPPRFAADSRGRLVLNADTHANLGKLLLQENPDAMRATLVKISKDLPAQAASELKVLVNQFQQYTVAHSHVISPEDAPQNEQQGLKLLDSLHALRVSYLGAEATDAMFGAEEATTRQLLSLMRADPDPTGTQQEKAERAQEIISTQTPRLPPAS